MLSLIGTALSFLWSLLFGKSKEERLGKIETENKDLKETLREVKTADEIRNSNAGIPSNELHVTLAKWNRK